METKYQKNDRTFWVAVFLFLAFFIPLSGHYFYDLFSDSISYLSIAQKYAAGNYFDAISAYWGPLISWLMALLFKLFGEMFLSYKVLDAVIGVATLFAFGRILALMRLSRIAGRTAMLSAVPVVLYFSLSFITPDLLLTCVLLYYFLLILSPNYSQRKIRDGLLIGLAGAMAYLTKAFGFYFFAVHFFLTNAVILFNADPGRRKNILKTFALGMAVFLAISSLWISALHRKYGRVMIDGTGSYVHANYGPQGSNFDPSADGGLMQPPDGLAVSIWEDPNKIENIAYWSPLDSKEMFLYQIQLTKKNLGKMITTLGDFSVMSFFIIAFGVLAAVGTLKNIMNRTAITIIMLGIFLNIASYAPLVVQPRHIWLTYLFLIILGAMALEVFVRSDHITRAGKIIAITIFVFTSIAFPLDNIRFTYNKHKNEFGTFLEISKQIPELKNKKIASNASWEQTLSFAYRSGMKYYGKTKAQTPREILKEIKPYYLDYFIYWDKNKDGSYKNFGPIKPVASGQDRGVDFYVLPLTAR